MNRTIKDRDGTIGYQRRLARSSLAVVASAMVAFVLFAGSSFGATAQPQALQTTESPTPTDTESPEPEPTPTETPAPTGPAVQLLNPAAEPLPNLANNELGDMRQVSDKYDGTDERFHVVAVTRRAPSGAVVEAFFQPDGGEEISVGQLRRLADSPDTWELFWDIPADFPQGVGTFKAKLFNSSGAEIAKDEETVQVNSEEDTVEITWPANGGQLGFFKPRTGGEWRTVIDGTASEFTSRVYVYYTTTAPGQEPTWKECTVGTGSSNSYNIPGVGEPREFRFFCALNPEDGDKDTPSQVTGFALIATGRDDPLQPEVGGIITEESSDVHRVYGFAQDVRKMSVELEPFRSGSTSASYPSPQHREAGTGCLVFGATVTDADGRPVVGASIDVHLQGPDDEVGFGNSSADGGDKPPDMGAHEPEEAYSCSGSRSGEQGQHENPGGDDIKHRESVGGTGLGSGAPPGTWRFSIYSPNPGTTRVQAWIDDAPLADESEVRNPDNDKRGEAEATDTISAYWLGGPAKVKITPASDSAVSGTCNEYTLSAQGGQVPVRDINVDVHATGPTNDLDFCTPTGGSARTAPEQGDHQIEDGSESNHDSGDPEQPNTQHTEGQTDSSGLFTFGITSPVAGDSSLQAWLDGYPGQDDDERQSSEPTATASKSWATTAQDAEVRFVNPSAYGGGDGDNISNKNDGNRSFHIVTRVDVPELVSGVEIYISEGTGFRKLGDAARVGDSDTFEFNWNTEGLSGTFTLRAQIAETQQREDRQVRVNNELETINLADPLNAEVVQFPEGKTPVSGTASAGAEGVTFYYTTTGAKDTNSSARWIECGSVELAAEGDGPQPFAGECALAEGDSAGEVSGIAALATTCDLAGCDPPLGSTIGETGDAHRVVGFSEPVTPEDPRGCTHMGDDGDNVIRGTNGDDIICAGAGDDTIYAGGGDDIIYGEGGHDSVRGNRGDDRMIGGGGGDTLRGGRGADTARGRSGNDTIRAYSENDDLQGGSGNDVISGSIGNDLLKGNKGRDTLNGGKGRDTCRGGAGKDTISRCER